jgi:tryptophan-rich hypothetical protein
VYMKNINPKKLLASKWTSVKVTNKEKHFIVTEIEFDENNDVLSCIIEAVLTKRSEDINWQELRDDTRWTHGWK